MESDKEKRIRTSTIFALVLLAIIIFLCIFIPAKICGYFKPISKEKYDQLHKDDPEVGADTNDWYGFDVNFVPNEDDGVTTVLILGDDYFAGDRSANGIAALVAKKTGATVYNVSFEGMSFAMMNNEPNWDDYPLEALCPYRLFVNLRYGGFWYTDTALERMEEVPDYYYDNLELFKSIDMNNVDVIILHAGANDYLAGHRTRHLYEDENQVDENMDSLYGAMNMTIQEIRANYPHIKIVISSPSFFYYVEEDGSQVSACIRPTYRGAGLLDYWSMMYTFINDYNVAFIDNFETIEFNEDTAHLYLDEDPLLPNQAGKELIADHIATFIQNLMDKQKHMK